MPAVITLIDKARSLCTPPTDYRLAKVLGIKTQTLSRVRNRHGTLDNEAATKLAMLLQQDPMDVIALMEVARAKTPEKRAFWESRLPRIVPLVALLEVISGLMHQASLHAPMTSAVLRLIHYAKYQALPGDGASRLAGCAR